MGIASRHGFVNRDGKNIEADEWRVAYDATHGVRVNNRIRVLDQIRFPAWPDLVSYVDEIAGDEIRVFLRHLEGPSTDSHGACRMGRALRPTTVCCT